MRVDATVVRRVREEKRRLNIMAIDGYDFAVVVLTDTVLKRRRIMRKH